MSNIYKAFENGKAIIAYITCGDPDIQTTAAAVRAAAANGADLIELGIPFSDPTAEGPIIQSASIRALRGGITTDKIFDLVRELRTDVRIPLVFMTYANVVFSYGAKRFISACREIGIDGLILSDLPYEEKEEFGPLCAEYGMELISFAAPARRERIAMIAKEAEGFVYIVPIPGAEDGKADIEAVVDAVHTAADIPCAVETGSPTPEQAAEAARAADGIIIGSAVAELMQKYGKEAPGRIGDYISSVKDAVNR